MTITAEEVAAAEAALIAAKQRKNKAALEAAKDECVRIRSEYRTQEQAAGRRALITTTED